MKRILVPVALLSTALAAGSTAACSSDSSSERALGARPGNGAPPDPQNLKEFTAIFRANHPRLAKDRPEEEIEKTIAEICVAQSSGPVSLRQVASAFANDGVTPDQTTVTEILKLAERTACALPEPPTPSAQKSSGGSDR